MNPADDPDIRSIAVEAVITSVLRRFYRLDDATQVLFDQALEDAAQSVEKLAASKPSWRGELKDALDIIEQVRCNMKKPLNIDVE
ncbi:MAG: hypothetical protein JJ911_16790 [Rhizobiaceae bacterium]|nr:hypothetical protein [Rhizobiaceae bacterium]